MLNYYITLFEFKKIILTIVDCSCACTDNTCMSYFRKNYVYNLIHMCFYLPSWISFRIIYPNWDSCARVLNKERKKSVEVFISLQLLYNFYDE